MAHCYSLGHPKLHSPSQHLWFGSSLRRSNLSIFLPKLSTGTLVHIRSHLHSSIVSGALLRIPIVCQCLAYYQFRTHTTRTLLLPGSIGESVYPKFTPKKRSCQSIHPHAILEDTPQVEERWK